MAMDMLKKPSSELTLGNLHAAVAALSGIRTSKGSSRHDRRASGDRSAAAVQAAVVNHDGADRQD